MQFRLLKFNRVIDNNICFARKEVYNIYEMFHTRYSMHKQVSKAFFAQCHINTYLNTIVVLMNRISIIFLRTSLISLEYRYTITRSEQRSIIR